MHSRSNRSPAHLISWILHHILVMKEAVLDFATRHELPVPSWWIDGTSSSTGASITSKGAHPIAACPTPTPVHVARLRGRRLSIRARQSRENLFVEKHALYHTWQFKGWSCQIGNKPAPKRGQA
jgi:hypothetical protein